LKTRLWIGLVVALGVGIAASQANLAAAYVAIGVGAIVYLLHAIEFKINKLLSDRGIQIYDDQIAKD
jgi:uncharacterized protein (DUF58 family)